ncbi:hypothetical protein [Desulfobacula sp.]|uniref:hypothetical protein n=1 Tax=Desulfobacula sp. TaxID=2593537 RepID=UPI001EBC4F42|nr:hypothetical protein [Desulfobacula sp.]
MDVSCTDLFSAAIGGGVIVKALDLAYAEYRRRSEVTESVVDFQLNSPPSFSFIPHFFRG